MRISRYAKAIKFGISIASLCGLYFLATLKHEDRSLAREASVTLTPGCEDKLSRYHLHAGPIYVSPYRTLNNGNVELLQGYSEEDVRAVQRGCNLVDDLLGQRATSSITRWHAQRYVRGSHTTCRHCHLGLGDKQNALGDRITGSLSLAAAWTNGGDGYDSFTGLLLPFELRQMQCFINSSNGYKPNINDDVIRDITAYSRFLAAALGLKYQERYDEQGIDEIPVSITDKQGDDYIRGASLYSHRCARCHGVRGEGQFDEKGKLKYPAVAGPNSFNRQSRNYFHFVSTILPGFICRNMPLGEEGTLRNQECRDLAYFISNLPRPAGDREGPLAAAWAQTMMATIPKIIELIEPQKLARQITSGHDKQSNPPLATTSIVDDF